MHRTTLHFPLLYFWGTTSGGVGGSCSSLANICAMIRENIVEVGWNRFPCMPLQSGVDPSEERKSDG